MMLSITNTNNMKKLWHIAIRHCLKQELQWYDKSILQKQLNAKNDPIWRITKDILYQYNIIGQWIYKFNVLKCKLNATHDIKSILKA